MHLKYDKSTDFTRFDNEGLDQPEKKVFAILLNLTIDLIL